MKRWPIHTLASAKIGVAGYEKTILNNHGLLNTEAEGFEFLFPDTHECLLMKSEHLRLVIKDRINEHKAAEAKKTGSRTEKIRQEEERKAQAEAERLAELERQRIATE